MSSVWHSALKYNYIKMNSGCRNQGRLWSYFYGHVGTSSLQFKNVVFLLLSMNQLGMDVSVSPGFRAWHWMLKGGGEATVWFGGKSCHESVSSSRKIIDRTLICCCCYCFISGKSSQWLLGLMLLNHPHSCFALTGRQITVVNRSFNIPFRCTCI